MRGLSFERLVAGFIEDHQGRRYGKYQGIVTEVDDPEKMGRIKARVPSVLPGEVTSWALPCAPFTGSDAGLFALPPVALRCGSSSRLGDVSRPIWSGGWWPRDSVPEPEEGKAGDQVTKVLKTDTGLNIALDDDKETLVVSMVPGPIRSPSRAGTARSR